MKILSIEIGVDVTHVLEMDYRVKNPKVYRSFSFQTPVGVIGEAGVRKSEEFRTALHKLLDANKIKTRKTLFVVNSGKIASREVLIPMIKENRIKDFLNTNSADFFPVDLSRYQLVYRNEGVVQQDTVKKRKLYVFAVPGDLVQSYEELADFCSLELTALDYVGNSIFQMMHKAVGNNICCSVKLDNNATMITIINQGMVVLQRTVSGSNGYITADRLSVCKPGGTGRCRECHAGRSGRSTASDDWQYPAGIRLLSVQK